MVVALAALLVGEGWWAARDYSGLPPAYRGLLIAFLTAGLVIGGVVELCRMARTKGFDPSRNVMLLVVIVLTLLPFLRGDKVIWLVLFLFVGLALASLRQGFIRRNEQALANLGIFALGVIYLGLGGWFLVQIRLLGRTSDTWTGQTGCLILFLACVKSADIGAYLIGRKIGRHKWVPSISPNKSWEGFIGGVLTATIVASLFGWGFGIIKVWQALFFGVIVGVTGQLGDLLESMFKRDSGSKDSARLVPEFGGVLDLLDSVLIAAAPAYLMLVWL
ncbi:MAG: phosphatidate cytidylyltransferase [Sedimentisphaerales bacterium]|nr:phosphatidate cytidylyltransferase [Sedimentisphaerales bacterium]